MGRMHSGGKGMASSALPYKRTPPSWAKATPKDVEEHVCKLAKKGLTPSQVCMEAWFSSVLMVVGCGCLFVCLFVRANRQERVVLGP